MQIFAQNCCNTSGTAALNQNNETQLNQNASKFQTTLLIVNHIKHLKDFPFLSLKKCKFIAGSGRFVTSHGSFFLSVFDFSLPVHPPLRFAESLLLSNVSFRGFFSRGEVHELAWNPQISVRASDLSQDLCHTADKQQNLRSSRCLKALLGEHVCNLWVCSDRHVCLSAAFGPQGNTLQAHTAGDVWLLWLLFFSSFSEDGTKSWQPSQVISFDILHRGQPQDHDWSNDLGSWSSKPTAASYSCHPISLIYTWKPRWS